MRISHETNDGASKSPDAPVSDESQQPISEPATPSDPASSSRSDFALDRGVPSSQYLDSNHDLGMVNHGSSSYNQLSPRQEYYHQGKPYNPERRPLLKRCVVGSAIEIITIIVLFGAYI